MSIFTDSVVKVTVHLTKDISVSLNVLRSIARRTFFVELKKKLLLTYQTEARLITAVVAQQHRFYVRNYTISNNEPTTCDLQVISEMPTLFPTMILENAGVSEVSVFYIFPLRVRIRGNKSSAGGSRKAFLMDMMVEPLDGLNGVLSLIGTEYMLSTPSDALITTEQGLLEHAVVSPTVLENSPPASEQQTAALERLRSRDVQELHVHKAGVLVPVLLCVPRVANYSDIALPVLLAAVTFPQLSTPPSGSGPHTLPVEGSHTEVLNALIKQGSAPLYGAMANLEKELNASEELAQRYNEILEITHRKLLMLNRCVMALNEHNETTHRLVIHEFVAAAMDYIKGEFIVEHAVTSSKDTNVLGYGPLDVYIPGHMSGLLICDCKEDPLVGEKRKDRSADEAGEKGEEEEEEEDESKEGADEEGPGQDAIIEGTQKMKDLASALAVRFPQRHVPFVKEAKSSMDDQKLAQSIAPARDIAVRRAKETNLEVSINVCLCTAHRYVYFVVRAPVPESGIESKPTVFYLGDVCISVLRMQMSLEDWQQKRQKRRNSGSGRELGPATRRPSYRPADELIVDRNEVDTCLKAMIAAVKEK